MLENIEDIDFEALYDVECENCHLQVEEKVYSVYASDDGYDSFCIGIFKSKEKAEKFVQLQDELDEYRNHYVQESVYSDDKVDLNSVVKEYYSFMIGTEAETEEDIDELYCNEPDDTIKRIYDEDLHVENSVEWGISVYSINSFNEAKETALKLWREKHESK